MHKILMTFALIALLVIFGMQNSDHVVVSFIFGGPVRVRLIFLLLIAAAGGFIAAYIKGLGREIRLKKQIRRSAGLSQLPPTEPTSRAIGDFDDEDQ